MSSARLREYQHGIAEEVARWPGTAVAFEHGGKHVYAVISFADQSRKVFFPFTPGDSRRGLLNSLADVRGVLRDMGAERTPEQKAAEPRTRRSSAGPRPVRPGEAVQREDRWLAPLATLRERMAT